MDPSPPISIICHRPASESRFVSLLASHPSQQEYYYQDIRLFINGEKFSRGIPSLAHTCVTLITGMWCGLGSNTSLCHIVPVNRYVRQIPLQPGETGVNSFIKISNVQLQGEVYRSRAVAVIGIVMGLMVIVTVAGVFIGIYAG